jgi:diguanylate cyclase (GGDEF)-like protein
MAAGWAPLGHAVAAVPLPNDLHAGETIVVRIRPASAAGAPRIVANDPAFARAVRGARGSGFVFGMLTAVMLLLFLAYILTFERSIPWFLAFCGSVALIELLHDGLLPGSHSVGGTTLLTVLDILNGIADTGFVVVYLRLWKQARRLFWATLGAIGVILAIAILTVAVPALHPWVGPLQTPLLTSGFAVLLAVTILRGARGYKPAWWLPPALLMLFFQPGYAIVRSHLGLVVPFLDLWAFEIGTVGDSFLFGLAVLARARYVVLERRSIERRLSEVTHAALHDALTGLLNRRGLFARMAAADRPGTVFYVDLDNFKMINDRYGHAAGDAVLVQVARTMRELVGDEGVVARIGGDEFVVVTNEVDRRSADALAFAFVTRIMEIGPEDAPAPKRFGASIGYVDFDGVHFEIALRRADAEAYRIKAEKRERVRA